MMKSSSIRRLVITGMLGLAVALAGCSSFKTAPVSAGDAPASAQVPATGLTPVEKVKAVAVTIDANCTVGAPLVATLRAVQTDQGAIDLLGKFQDKAAQVCKVAAAVAHPVAGASLPTLDLAGAKSFLDAQTPALIVLVKGSKLDDKAKSATILAITGAQLALTMASLNQ